MKLDNHLGDFTEWVLCRFVGCTSVFSKWSSWPYTKVCNPFVTWRISEEMSTYRVIKDKEVQFEEKDNG